MTESWIAVSPIYVCMRACVVYTPHTNHPWSGRLCHWPLEVPPKADRGCRRTSAAVSHLVGVCVCITVTYWGICLFANEQKF